MIAQFIGAINFAARPQIHSVGFGPVLFAVMRMLTRFSIWTHGLDKPTTIMHISAIPNIMVENKL